MTSTTIDLPDDLHARVQELAQTRDRPIAVVLAEAVAHYVEWDRRFRAAIDKGRRSAEMGPLVPAEEVWANFLRRGLVTPEALEEAEVEGAQESA